MGFKTITDNLNLKKMIRLKNISKVIYSIVTFALVLTSCNEENPIESDITFYPTFEVIGGELYAIELGVEFNDPGVIAREDGNELSVTVSGVENVNTDQIGAYVVTYAATNSDGFEATISRTVVVHDPAIVGTDVSGNIQDANNNTRKAVISLVEGTTSIFYVTDFAFSGTFPMYFQMDGDTISEIAQSYVFGVENVDLTYDPVTMEFSVTVNPQGFAYTFEYQ